MKQALHAPSAQSGFKGIRTNRRGFAGQTLFEITVLVTALMVLAGAVLPAMGDSIANARIVRAKREASDIAAAVSNAHRDLGDLRGTALATRDTRSASMNSTAVSVLFSDGIRPGLADVLPGAATTTPATMNLQGEPALRSWASHLNADALDAHVRINGRQYPASNTNGAGRVWNGPYLTSAITSDPWGHAYLVNAEFLSLESTALDPRLSRAVFVLSAGPNGIVETPFSQSARSARAFGDDIIVRVQ
jgi:hypothetical protein